MKRQMEEGKIKRQIFLKIILEVGEEENKRQMENNVMQEMRALLEKAVPRRRLGTPRC